MMTQATVIAWNWNTQYYLTVITLPTGLSPIGGSGWYDSGANVILTAPSVISGDTFMNWEINTTAQSPSLSAIVVTMNGPTTATAYYQGPSPMPASTVGGWSVSLAMQPPLSTFGVYFTLIAASGLVLALRKRRRK
jgi:hypothetical protein